MVTREEFLVGTIEALDAIFYSVPQPSRLKERWELAKKGYKNTDEEVRE